MKELIEKLKKDYSIKEIEEIINNSRSTYIELCELKDMEFNEKRFGRIIERLLLQFIKMIVKQ